MGTNAFMNQQRIEGQTFVGATVQLDGGVAYIKCRFVNCQFIYAGVGPVNTQECIFEPNCRWGFAGPAGNTLNFLRAMYASGNTAFVEQIFESIRTGVVPTAMTTPPGSDQGHGPIVQ
jgi:hypothetical protein